MRAYRSLATTSTAPRRTGFSVVTAYAAYGGIYIAASLVSLWVVEGQQPTAIDMFGAGLAIIGALVIVGLASRT